MKFLLININLGDSKILRAFVFKKFIFKDMTIKELGEYEERSKQNSDSSSKKQINDS